jgi:alkylation response protein AidB-like acyl-CoA dehydrogenase
MEVLGQGSYVAKNSPAAIIEGELEHAYRAAPVGTFGGGVNEVQREIIATVGLGMPRAPR